MNELIAIFLAPHCSGSLPTHVVTIRCRVRWSESCAAGKTTGGPFWALGDYCNDESSPHQRPRGQRRMLRMLCRTSVALHNRFLREDGVNFLWNCTRRMMSAFSLNLFANYLYSFESREVVHEPQKIDDVQRTLYCLFLLAKSAKILLSVPTQRTHTTFILPTKVSFPPFSFFGGIPHLLPFFSSRRKISLRKKLPHPTLQNE